MFGRGRAKLNEVVTVAGVGYVPISGPVNFLHDTKATAFAARAGFMDEPAAGEALDEFIRRQTIRFGESGLAVEMLGYYVIPIDKRPEDWTPQLAEATSAALGRVSSSADLEKVNGLLVRAVIHFFALARRSLGSLPSYSETLPEAVRLLSPLARTAGIPSGTGLGSSAN